MMMITNNETINTKKIFYNEMMDTGRLMEKKYNFMYDKKFCIINYVLL